MIKKILLIATLLLGLAMCFSSCIEQPNSYTKLPPGPWRGVLKLTDPDAVPVDNINDPESILRDYFELPFNLNVEYQDGQLVVSLKNGEELIPIEKVYYGRDPATAKDTLRLEMTAFDTYIDAYYEDNYIEGYWVVNYKDNYKIPFLATYGQNHRFLKNNEAATTDLTGQWKVMFNYDQPDSYPAIAEFIQKGNELNGTFRTETGDYRFLSGNCYQDKMRLSVFDGAHAFLFSGSIEKDTIYGEFRSGSHYKSKWKAYREPSYVLPDPYDMTKGTADSEVSFSFPNSKGDLVSLNKSTNDHRLTLVNIMGTWCPNCRDEIEYLKEIQKAYANEDLHIYSIAFERYREEAKALLQLDNFQKVMDFDWPLLLGGYANKKETSETFGFLDKIYSYPTLIVIDNQNNIQHIHTGFNGPATSVFEDFDKDFRAKLDQLLK